MMNLDEAIKHCEEVAKKQDKLCEISVTERAKEQNSRCADEHRQLAEWLKELKAYREQSGDAISNLAMCHILNHEVKWINERMTREGVGRMNEAEKERLIKKDIESIENRVRHAFNQGYEIGLKESSSEIPNTCGDAISRQAVLDAMYELCDTGETLKENPWRDNPHIDAITNVIDELPSVTPQQPQQRTGYWEWVQYDGCCGNWHCSECRTIIPHMPEETDNTPIYKWCPMCGAKMEVEEC